MNDPPGNIGYWRWKRVTWAAPGDINRLLIETRVQLEVQLSYPDPQSEIDSWNNRENKSHRWNFPWDRLSAPH
jgi:hypothetical protein